MLTLLLLGLVVLASSIMGAVTIWGVRHKTLRESDQERIDRRFQQIVTIDRYSSAPGPS